MSEALRGTMEGSSQRWLWGVSFDLCRSRKAMANSRAQNLIQTRQRYNSSHETKQRDRPDQEKNELSRLVLIMNCSREMWTSLGTLLDAAKEDEMTWQRVWGRIQKWVTYLEQHCKQSFAGNNFFHLQRSRGSRKKRRLSSARYEMDMLWRNVRIEAC